jgi:hypothetical protein
VEELPFEPPLGPTHDTPTVVQVTPPLQTPDAVTVQQTVLPFVLQLLEDVQLQSPNATPDAIAAESNTMFRIGARGFMDRHYHKKRT